MTMADDEESFVVASVMSTIRVFVLPAIKSETVLLAIFRDVNKG